MVSTEEVLQRGLQIAAKLKLSSEEHEFINNELTGYNNSVPSYRVTQGELKAFNQFINQWVDIDGLSPEYQKKITRYYVREPIAILETLSTKNSLEVSLPKNLEIQIMKSIGGIPPAEIKLLIDPILIKEIIVFVRNKLLDLLLKLEDAESIGKKMNFSEEAQKKAQTHTTVNCFGNANIIAIEKAIVQIQQSPTNSSQSLIENSYDPKIREEFLGLIHQIQKKYDSESFTNEQKLEIKGIFESLKTEIKSSSPKKALLKKLCDQLKQKVPSAVSLTLQFLELLDKFGIKI